MSTRYLKNARVEKDGDGDYWLHIESGSRHAMFCLSEVMDLEAEENSEIRLTLESWFADQDSGNGN
jgi:hypothetical protein